MKIFLKCYVTDNFNILLERVDNRAQILEVS